MNGLVVVHLLHEIECSAVKKKKDETVDTHNDLDESSGNYIVWGETYIKKLLVEGKDNQKRWF